MNLNNPTGKILLVILSKILGKIIIQKKVSGESGLHKEIQADFVKNVTGLLLSTLE